MKKKTYFTGKGARKEPLQPLGPTGPTFYDIRLGDRVEVTGSGRTGTVVRTDGAHGERKVKWDEPVFGAESGWVAWSNLRPVAD